MFKYLTLTKIPRIGSNLPIRKNFQSHKSNISQFNFFNTLSYKSFALEVPVYSSQFRSRASGEPGRSQRGIWQGKNHGRGYKISHSEVHTLRKFKVNSQVATLWSERLKKHFFLNCSTKAIKTIKKYGGLDRYLLTTKDKFIKDSQFAQYLKGILLKAQKDPHFRLYHIPFTRKPKFVWKRRERSEVKNIPSIYIPPEAKRMDLSEMYYPIEYFENRLEKQKREEVEKQLEQESDPLKRDELKKQLNLDRYTNKMRKDMTALMPFRHKLIRDGLVKLRDKPTVKLNFLKTLENSENYTKLMMGEQYKHFSEDYPEVQLILQQTEEEKFRKQRGSSKLYKGYAYDFGETYEETSKKAAGAAFEPFEKKSGQKWEKPAKRMNAKMVEKLKARSLKKEKKMGQKKEERSKNKIRDEAKQTTLMNKKAENK